MSPDRLRRAVPNLGLSPAERRLAAAIDGDDAALDALARDDDAGELARRHRAGPALALRAALHAPATPATAAWRQELLAAAARHLQARATAEEVGGLLGDAGIDWAPLKGYDLATRFYGAPEERPAADLDVLIPRERIDDAREKLVAAGWRDSFAGRRYRRYVADEGYTWIARKAGHTLVEIHFRLWGLVPEAWAASLLEDSLPDPDLGPGGRRLSAAGAYLVAAVHTWMTPAPRPLGPWWDLARISDRMTKDDAEAAVDEARRWDLVLPVTLAAEVSAELWRRDACRRIARRLPAALRPLERRAAARARRRGLVDPTLARLQAARLLSGRRSRLGWRAVWRQIWAHPGIVERATPEDWSWPARRLGYLAGRFRD